MIKLIPKVWKTAYRWPMLLTNILSCIPKGKIIEQIHHLLGFEKDLD